MSVKPILLERTGPGRGLALGPGGRFYHVRVPEDLQPGEELPGGMTPLIRRSFLIAAAASLLLGATVLVFLPGRGTPDFYALVDLRFAHRLRQAMHEQKSDPAGTAATKDLHVTLAVDRRGTVAAVRPHAQDTRKMVGMHVEEAIQYTVGQLTEITEGGVEVRPGPGSTENEAEALRDRIETALPEHAPPFVVAIGPPAEETQETKSLLRKLLPRLRKPGKHSKAEEPTTVETQTDPSEPAAE